MRSLVLGGSGFIGGHLCEYLARHGHRVLCFDRRSILRSKPKNPRITFFKGDFRRKKDIELVLRNTDYVFHFASMTQPYSSADKPVIEIIKVVAPVVRLLEACVKYKIRKVIFPSSGGLIYGTRLRFEKISENTQPAPVLPHAIAKLAIEDLLWYFYKTYGLDFCVLRLSNIYGPRGPARGTQGVVTIFMNKIMRGQHPVIFSKGDEIRDYLYIDDAVRAIAVSVTKQRKEKVFNVGTGRGYSVLEIFKKIKRLCDSAIAPQYAPSRVHAVRSIALDSRRFRKAFGWRPKISLDAGLSKTFDWLMRTRYKKYRE